MGSETPELAVERRLNGELPFYAIDQYGFTVYEHGAHVASWSRANGDPVLFMSAASNFKPGKPIRGGVPICFPWFGPRAGFPDAPAHGFARTRSWHFAGNTVEDGLQGFTFTLKSDEETRQLWPFDFEATYTALVGPDTLKLRFSVELQGGDPTKFEAVLHTYFTIADIRSIEIEGLEGSAYLDKLTDQELVQEGPITFTGEVDRVHNASSGNFVINDPGLKRRITINTDAPSTVVWNPWIDKAIRLADFGDEEWPGMVCVESGIISADQKDVIPGQPLTFEVTYRVEDI